MPTAFLYPAEQENCLITSFVLTSLQQLVMQFLLRTIHNAVHKIPFFLIFILVRWALEGTGYLSSLKIHRPRPGLNPRILGPMANTLPLDHQRRHKFHIFAQSLVISTQFNPHKLFHSNIIPGL
jgi:hypothetical protein